MATKTTEATPDDIKTSIIPTWGYLVPGGLLILGGLVYLALITLA